MMKKNILTIFFLTIFLSLILAPTLLIAVDNTIDVSLFYSISEEEEEKGNKKDKEFEVFVLDANTEVVDSNSIDHSDNLEYQIKTYSKPQLNLISPPPEFIS